MGVEMRYLSVCSGIEAASVAWKPLGWSAVGFSEIEKFPCSVLKYRYPETENFGDMTKFKEWPDANIDVLVGGTPCQSFSIAGLRKGLDDPRGNLMLTYLAIADRYKPKYIVWENVAGILSSNGGRDFGTFLGGLGKLGYGFAYRVLDAQYCRTHEHPRAVPQRRRRVFVVGCLGSWRSAAGIIFDSESLRGNPPPSRNKGEEIAGTISKCSFSGGASGRPEGAAGNHFLPVTFDRQSSGEYGTAPVDSTISRSDYKSPSDLIYIGGIDYENNGHGMDVTGPLMKGSPTGGGRPLPAVAYNLYGGNKRPDRPDGGFYARVDDVSKTLDASGGLNPNCSQGGTAINTQMRVRRLTPLECERLQGFPDFWTDIPGASNTARYKALGNSMAVNSMRILGERIAMAESIL
jgi:DNA (cytosine-5)-methyltransferase 1